jgi:hypothetical protein
MIAADEDALTCDFAEIYHVIEWRALPVRTAAVLAFGLSEDSRIKRKLSKMAITIGTMLQATTADCLRLILWQNSVDGSKGINKPSSILEQLTGDNKPKEQDFVTFDSPEEFERLRAAILAKEVD